MGFCPSRERQGYTKNMTIWNRLILCKQMKSCFSKILPTKYSFRNLRLNVYKYKQNLALNNLQDWYAIKPNQPTLQQTMNLWSCVCNARPPYFWISGGILSYPTALPLFRCSLALVTFLVVVNSSSSVFTSCWGTQRIADSWTGYLALKKAWKYYYLRLGMDTFSVRRMWPSALRIGHWT